MKINKIDNQTIEFGDIIEFEKSTDLFMILHNKNDLDLVNLSNGTVESHMNIHYKLLKVGASLLGDTIVNIYKNRHCELTVEN